MHCFTCSMVGYAQFSTPQAAARAENIYQGWQGYGNPEGLRIEFANTEEGPMTAKRPREGMLTHNQPALTYPPPPLHHRQPQSISCISHS